MNNLASFPLLHTRYLMDNNIGVIHESEFKGIIGVQLLDLTNSSISEIKGSPFAVMESLKMLHLRNNHLKDESMVTGLHGMPKINFIELNGNSLTRVPNINSSVSPHLKNLHVTHNNISSISRHDLRGMDNVDFLYLAWNPLEGFGESDDTFAECGKLRGLDMVHTRISSLPNMTFLPKLENLHVNSARLTSIPEDLCCSCSNLKFLEVSNNGIASLPNISCEMLYDLDASHNKIESMHPDFLKDMKYLNRLSLESNFISEIDTDFFKENINLEHLSLKHNKLVKLPSLSEVPHLIDFDASYNRIKKIDKGTFVNQVIMDELYLNDNQIGSIDPEAFSISSDLKVLNLSNNVNLREWMVPRGGFPFLAILSLEGLPNLHQVPHMFELRRVQELYFTYSYHCCIWEGYIRPTEPTMSFEEEGSGSLSYTKTTVPPPKLPENIVDCNNQTAWENFVKIYNMHFCETMNCLSMNCNQLGNSIYTDETMIIGDMSEEVFTSRGGKRKKIVYSDKVSCIPHNSPLTPCENLMDPWILRIAIWAIWVLALLGNGTVLFIGIATKGKLESNDLLICNLAFADFCMGVYLAFLAVVDIRTFTDSKSTFYQSALDWQLGPGCKSAGFIAVFSTELSIFILVVLTLERVYTISHTFDQNEEKRRKVVIGLCVFGWFWAAGLAMLPIFGVNSYDKVAVCLPYVTENWWDRFYIGFILTLNFAFFVVIVFSYAYIFIHACRVSPSGHLKQRRKDILTAVSKIAVLILTAFFCWAPIAVIGYLSLINLHLVSAAEAKYFVIFVYPLNACVNPFIYAIFTRGFRNKFSSIFQRSKDRVTSFPPNDRRRRSAFAPEYNMNERHSPGGEELMKLRQSRRSNSLVVQFVDSNLTTPSPTFNPPLGCNFGRRASLPPGFGSTLNSLDTVGHGSQGSSNSHLPHYSLPFRLGSVYDGQNSSLPNLPEESDGDYEAEPTLRSSKSENIDQRTAVLTSSLDSNLRRLSVVEEEENEVETPGNFYPCEKEDSLDEDEDGNKDENVSVSSSEDYSDASDIPFGGGCGEEMCTDLDSLMVGGTGVILSSTAEVRIRKTCSRGGDSIKSRDSAYTTGHHSKSYSLEDVRIASLSSDHSDYHPDISSHVMFQREREDIEQFMTSHSDSRTNDMRKAFSDSEFRSERKMDGSESSEGCNIVHRANCSLSHVHMLSSREICEHDRINQHHVDENIKNADSSLVPKHIRSGLIISKQQPRDDDGGSGSEDCNTHSSNFSSRSSSVSPEPLIINNDTTIQAKKSTKLILEKTIETDL